MPSRLPVPVALLAAALLVLPARAAAQDPGQVPPLDSIAVEGNQRLTDAQVQGTSGLIVNQTINYRDVQRAILALFATGQFDDVQVNQVNDNGRLVLVIRVRERPILRRWAVRGPEKISARTVRERVKLVEGRPIDRAGVAASVASIDS
ncbi:MAG: POTRA domain-containing protein, partial [Gemmatimonadales bacterium]